METLLAWGIASAGLVAFIAVILTAIAIYLFFFFFWIFMFADLLQRDFEERNIWIAIMVIGVFTGFMWLTALLYYFLVKRKGLYK